jgi:TonB family protein
MMKALETFVLNYALNAAWQLPLLFFAAWVATRLLRSEGAAAEHRVWSTVLFLAAVAPVAPSFGGALTDIFASVLALLHRQPAQAVRGNVTVRTGPAWAHGSLAFTGTMAHITCALLLAITVGFALRLLWSLTQTRRLAKRAEALKFPVEAMDRWLGLCALLGVTPPQIAASSSVGGPVVLGVVRPLLLVPMEFLQELSQAEFDAAMAHELAHVRRRDFALHLAVQVVALPLRWHPLTWLLLARMEQSREAACDAMAAKALHGPQSYARSLLKLAAWIGDRNSTPNPHALGLFESGPLERRIMLLTERSSTLSRRTSVLLRGVAALLLGASCAAAMAMHLGINPRTPQSTGANVPIHVKGGIMAGQIVSKVNPVYPPDAKAAKVQGAVILDAIIAKDGTVQNLKVVSGPDELQRSAVDAVRQWVYKPYLLNGQPTEVETKITITYSLAN